MRRVQSIGWCLLAVVLLSSCAAAAEPVVSKSSGPAFATSAPAYDHGTALRVVKRLWPEMKRTWLLGDPTLGSAWVAKVKNARPGSPAAVSRDYAMTEPILVRWVLPDDLRSVGAGMFGLMRPTPTSSRSFIVPVAAQGRTIAEFLVEQDAQGSWDVVEMAEGPAQSAAFCSATRTLKRLLGKGTVVRPVMFLPSGLAFAVGENGGREAAVYLTFVNEGAGVSGFDKYLPKTGRLFTPVQLQELLSP